jgi:hypothetical protein
VDLGPACEENANVSGFAARRIIEILHDRVHRNGHVPQITQERVV